MSTDNPNTNNKLTNAEIDAALGVEGTPDIESQSEQIPLLGKSQAEITNTQIWNQWVEYMLGPSQNASGTVYHRERRMLIFDRWLKAKLPNKTYLDLTKEEIRSYMQFLIDKGDRPNTLTASFQTLKALYFFLTEEEGLMQKNPCPLKVRIRKQHELDSLITLPNLLQVRINANDDIGIDSKTKVPLRRNVLSALRRYAAFEVLLSTGVTVSELNRLNVNDINFNDVVFDKKLNSNSPYVCGSITLNPAEIGVKKRRFRKVYLNPIAAKLLKLHIYHHGLYGDIPIFPWPIGTIQNWMARIGLGVLREDKPFIAKKVSRRSKHKTEVFIDPKSTVSHEIKNAIERQQARAVFKDNAEEKAEIKYKLKTTSLHPHALRHVNACVMMYRDWRGGYHDLMYVKRLLGHSLRSMTALAYTDHADYLSNDRQWIKLMCGDPRSYWRLLHHLEKLDPKTYVKPKSHHKKGSKYNP